MEDDRKSRIAARRARMEGRSTASESRGDDHSDESKEAPKGATKVAESLAALDAKKSRSIDYVTSVRVDADRHENERRIEEEDRRQDRLWRLQEEAVASGKANAAVEMRWNDLMDHNMPQDLHREIEAQKAACRSVISSKDVLIAEFQVELKAKDEEYVKALQEQREEIEELIKRMTEQFQELQDSYEIELEHVEDAFLNEREALLAANKREIDALFEKRREMEVRFVEDKLSREAAYQAEVDEMQAEDAENYKKLKIRLETDIQILQQQLQHMQATYLLNTEKLEYNFRVLTEKDGENRTTQIQQKRKLARLKDAQAAIMQRYHDADKRFKAKNAELTEEYRRITSQYKELQSKFRHFEAADQRRFQEVWAMHEETVGAMMKRLTDADRVIHEQLLGWEWVPPSTDLLGDYRPGTRAAGSDALGATAATAATATSEVPPYAVPEEGGGDRLTAVLEAKKAQEHSGRVRQMLNLLVAECDFLIPASTKEAAAALPESEGNIARADAILKAIGVETQEDIAQLLTYFFEDDQDSVAEPHPEGSGTVDGESSLASGPSAGPEVSAEPSAAESEASGRATAPLVMETGSRLKVDVEGVVQAVRKFVDDRAASKDGAGVDPFAEGKVSDGPDALKMTATGGGAAGAGGPGSTLGARSDGITFGTATRAIVAADGDRARVVREESDYWKRLAGVIPPRTIRIWKALERGLVAYNKLLEDRQELVTSVDSLREQNEELKKVLNQYLGDRVNDELVVPPTQTIRL